MTSEEIVNYYVDRLILQYHEKPRARATVAAFVREAVANLLFLRIADAFDLETASDARLDILAKYIGIPRAYITGELNQEYFGFADYNRKNPQNPTGFRDYDTDFLNGSGIWLQYGFAAEKTALLDDATFRVLMKLKILSNTTDATLPGMMTAVRQMFGDAVTLEDNKDMTLTYKVDASVIVLPKTVLERTLPRPAGVGLNVKMVRARFAFCRYATYDGEKRNRYQTGFRRYAKKPTGGQFVRYATYDG
jgi:hypothetical protein